MFIPGKLAVAIALISGALLVGCNGGSSSSSSSPSPGTGGSGGGGGTGGTGGSGGSGDPALQAGRFVQVEGIGVTAPEVPAAVTGAGGSFQYQQSGDQVVFSIGDIALPSVGAKETITPLDMSATGATYDDRVLNIMRLLETLDADPTSPGIQITQASRDAANSVTLDFNQTPANFANDTTLINYLSAVGLTELASQADATRTLHCGLAQVGVSTATTLVGAHLVRDEDEVVAVLVFARDGRFYMAQLIEEPEFDSFQGYEVGTYSLLGDGVRFNMTEDTNGTAGLLSDESGPGACPSDGPSPNVLKILSATATVATFETNEVPPDEFSAERIDTAQGEMAGAWRLEGQDVVLVIDGDDLGGDYYLIEFGSADAESKGIEAGTYTRSGNVMTATPLIDTNGDAGLSDVGGSFNIDISDGRMTFTIEEEDGPDVVTFVRID